MIRTIKIGIRKPLNCSWDQFGNAIRKVHSACTAGANYAQTIALRQDDAFSHIIVDEDKNWLSFPKKKNGKPDKPKLNSSVDKQAYHYMREQFPYVSSRMANFVTRDVVSRYKLNRWKILTGKASAPSYRNPKLMTDQYTWKTDNEGNVVLSICILSTASNLECPTRVELSLFDRKLRGDQASVFRQLISGDKKNKTISVVYNPRNKKWLVCVPVEVDVNENKFVDNRIMFVYPPGEREFLTCECRPKDNNLLSDIKRPEDRWTVRLEHDSSLGFRKKYEDCSKSISAKYRQDSGTSAIGHGRPRALKHKENRLAKYRRACKTFNQQRASYIIKQALRWKCDRIHYVCPSDMPEDHYRFADSWPWYQLEECIKNKAEENGIQFDKLDDSAKLEEIKEAIVKIGSKKI